ncbi:hypothetical protein [Ramlibacter alkalitolerans]
MTTVKKCELLAKLVLLAAMAAPALAEAGPWRYETKKDKMTGVAIRYARSDANNTLRLPFPYSGATHGRITVRDRDGVDVMVQVDQGQILCHDDCSVLVKFDDQEAESFGASGSNDHDPTTIFLDDAVSFVEKARNAKRIMVRMLMYQAGQQTLTFNTGKPLAFELPNRTAEGEKK